MHSVSWESKVKIEKADWENKNELPCRIISLLLVIFILNANWNMYEVRSNTFGFNLKWIQYTQYIHSAHDPTVLFLQIHRMEEERNVSLLSWSNTYLFMHKWFCCKFQFYFTFPLVQRVLWLGLPDAFKHLFAKSLFDSKDATDHNQCWHVKYLLWLYSFMFICASFDAALAQILKLIFVNLSISWKVLFHSSESGTAWWNSNRYSPKISRFLRNFKHVNVRIAGKNGLECK